jgi:hypothetical protein
VSLAAFQLTLIRRQLPGIAVTAAGTDGAIRSPQLAVRIVRAALGRDALPAKSTLRTVHDE